MAANSTAVEKVKEILNDETCTNTSAGAHKSESSLKEKAGNGTAAEEAKGGANDQARGDTNTGAEEAK